LEEWNNDNVTSGGGTSSNTNLTDEHIHTSEHSQSLISIGLSTNFMSNQSSELVSSITPIRKSLTITVTELITVHPAGNSST